MGGRRGLSFGPAVKRPDFGSGLSGKLLAPSGEIKLDVLQNKDGSFTFAISTPIYLPFDTVLRAMPIDVLYALKDKLDAELGRRPEAKR